MRTRARTTMATALAVAIVALGNVAGFAQGRGELAIRLTEAPADRADDPRARAYIIDHVGPGVSFERRIEVTSTSADPLTVDLYAAGAEIADGRFTAAPDRQQSKASGWIGIEPSRLEVPPNTAVQATVTVSVPADAPAGEHYAVVWAQPPAGAQGGATVVNRVGIRVYLSVGSGGEPTSGFTVTGLRARRDATGRPVVEAELLNTGGRAIDVTGELTLSDGPAGLSAGPFAAEPGTTIEPGGRAPMVVLLGDELPDGPWTARLVARSGLLEREAVGQVTFPPEAGAASGPSPVVVTPIEQQRRLLIPLAGSMIVLALAAIVLVWLWARRQHRRREQVPVEERPREPVG